jgi:hypothetical protein
MARLLVAAAFAAAMMKVAHAHGGGGGRSSAGCEQVDSDGLDAAYEKAVANGETVFAIFRMYG